MCIKVPGHPFRLVLHRFFNENGMPREIYTYVLGKVTELRHGGEHQSQRGFSYPIGKSVTDPNAEAGHHEKVLHLIGNPASDKLDSYGSHPLAVLAFPLLWEPPVEGEQATRCWHTSGVTPLFCLSCAGLTADDLNNPAFWDDLTTPRRSRNQANPDEFVLRLPRDSVWHKEAVLSPN